mmetsp:Transcript_42280/g.95628  ORF Transcript_42280/g.95628 Transcript_42280/m.95628 type:complete len:202 (+) Transcript_42280:1906-2511(+)
MKVAAALVITFKWGTISRGHRSTKDSKPCRQVSLSSLVASVCRASSTGSPRNCTKRGTMAPRCLPMRCPTQRETCPIAVMSTRTSALPGVAASVKRHVTSSSRRASLSTTELAPMQAVARFCTFFFSCASCTSKAETTLRCSPATSWPKRRIKSVRHSRHSNLTSSLSPLTPARRRRMSLSATPLPDSSGTSVTNVLSPML